MNRQRKLNWRKWLLAAAAALLLVGGRAKAATARETNEWNAAVRFFGIGNWASAETNFWKFTATYPESEFYAQAVVKEAQSTFKLVAKGVRKYADVVSLLDREQGRAGDRADEFFYWKAEAYYLDAKYREAADNYARIASEYPGSTKRAESLFGEAIALSKLGETARVIEILQPPGGAFQQLAASDPTNEWVTDGLFLLAQTELAQTNFAAAETAWREIQPQPTNSESEWNRQYLFSRILSESRPEAALEYSTNLVSAAGENKNWQALGRLLLGDVYEKLDRKPEAMAVYGIVLTNGPPEQQRKALQYLIRLQVQDKMIREAAGVLTDFVTRHPDDKASDQYMVLLGNLQLNQHFGQTTPDAATNFLQLAETSFLNVLQNTNGERELLGLAQLGLGWCRLAETNLKESNLAFSNAVDLLPVSEDKAVALYKLADTSFQQGDYTGAIRNYSTVVDQYGSFASVSNSLFEPALYQILLAGVTQTNLTAASDALDKIIHWFPHGSSGEAGVLLLSQAETAAGNVAEGRQLLLKFTSMFPDSPLIPETKLVMALNYEKEDDWTNARSTYYSFVETYTNHPSLPNAEFSLAWADYEAGNSNQAFAGFSNFVAQYPSNNLAARALDWMGHYYWDIDDFPRAEAKFKEVFNSTGPVPLELRIEAKMMAGRAAIQRSDPAGAISDYFKPLSQDTNYPDSSRLEAYFAWADALTVQGDYIGAIQKFQDIATNHPDYSGAPVAWGRLGDCYLQLGKNDANQYPLATNAYMTVLLATNANMDSRCLAEIGLGNTLEKMARSKSPGDPERRTLLNDAVNHYENIVTGAIIRGNEQPDLYYVKEATYNAARILKEDLGDLDQARNLYQKLLELAPELQKPLNTLIEGTRKPQSEAKNN